MGVTLTEWKDFLEYKWHLIYTKIVYRKLICKRSLSMLSEFESFIKVTAILLKSLTVITGEALQDTYKQALLQ